MDDYTKKQMHENGLNYKRTLEGIIEKYSKLKYHDGGIEVDLQTAKTRELGHYMELSKMELSKLDSKNPTGLIDRSLRAQDITSDTLSDYSHQNGGADESGVSSYHSTEYDGMSGIDSTELAVSSLSGSPSFSETVLQPEDQDEELEKSLRSQGTSLMELYPSMISQIGKAWHRWHVSEAADSVLRRYQRLRWLSNRSNLNHTFNVTLRHTNSNPKMMINRKAIINTSPNSSLHMNFPRISNKRTDTALRSPLHTVTNLQDWQVEKQSPGREGGALKRDLCQPVLVMDFSGISSAQESSEPKEISLNQTFTVSQVSPLSSPSRQREQPTALTVSPTRPRYLTTDAPMDPSSRLALPKHTVQRAECPVYVMEASSVIESSTIHYSPVRQSPLKTRLMRLTREDYGRSPYTLSRSPKSDAVGSYFREPKKSRSMPASPSSSLQKSTMSPRRLYPQDSLRSCQPKRHSPQPSTTAGRHWLHRHFSFDSSFPSSSVSHSPRELEDEFQKLYHRFVCQSKSSLTNGPPCRVCARSSETNRGHSSSALAALALSPHRSVLRKRYRELDQDSSPQSKRSRDGCCAYSPGSQRYGKEMLRRQHHSTTSPRSSTVLEASHDNLSYSCNKDTMAQVFGTQWPSTGARQEEWMAQGRPLASSEFSSLERRIQSVCGEKGSSIGKAKWKSGCSPRRRLLNKECTSGRKACSQHFPNYCQCLSVLENN